jgi:putative sigma-54 modulation protein
MQVLVTFRHMDATAALRDYAESKVARVHKYLRRPIEAHVILEVSKRRHMAEITLTGEHMTVNAKETTGDLYSAIDLAMDKVERQIQKHITRRDKRKHPGAAATKGEAAPPPRGRRRPEIVPERVAVESMTVADAVRQLSRDSGDFLIFQNDASDALSILYRRKDGGYGLIEPDIG